MRGSGERLPFDLASLQVFLTICDTKTMASAARLLGLTQPAVSQVILDMERKLGTQLFDRTIRPIALTQAGIILQQRARALVTEARQIIPLLQRTRRGYLPVLRVGMVDSVTRSLADIVLRVLSPAADQLIVLSGLAATHASALLTRQLDLLIGIDDLIEVGGLERRLIMAEPYVLILRQGEEQAELANLVRTRPFIRYSARSITGDEIDRYLRSLGCEPPRGIEFDAPFGVSSAVLSGYGWAVTTPLCMMDAGLPLDAFTILPLPPPGLRRSVTVVSRHQELGPAPREICGAAVLDLQARLQRQYQTPALRWIYEAMSFGTKSLSRTALQQS